MSTANTTTHAGPPAPLVFLGGPSDGVTAYLPHHERIPQSSHIYHFTRVHRSIDNIPHRVYLADDLSNELLRLLKPQS